MVRRYISVVSIRSLTRTSSPMPSLLRTCVYAVRACVWQALRMTTSAPLVVPTQFHGPVRSGNGGWTAGALAERLAPDDPGQVVTVALRQPPPLDTPLAVTATDRR